MEDRTWLREHSCLNLGGVDRPAAEPASAAELYPAWSATSTFRVTCEPVRQIAAKTLAKLASYREALQLRECLD